MDDRYFLRSNDKIHGPFPFVNLKKLASRGNIAVSDFISQDRLNWTPAGDCPGLFAAGAAPAPIQTAAAAPMPHAPVATVTTSAPMQNASAPKRSSKALDAGFTICTKGLGREVTDEATGEPKMLIRDVGLTIKSGEFVGLVGSSGAGKSTLFGALSGRVRGTHGQVLFDGQDLYANFETLRASIGYVPQKDVFHDSLPVGECLRATSRLRLPRNSSARAIEDNIDRVLAIVSLTKKKDTVISRLSGGEQKRVGIAMELLSRPRVLFLDEPTAPLDPLTKSQMVQLFRELAQGGITVIMVTHDPDSLISCDVVAYMHYGLMTFIGPPDQIMPFFGVDEFGRAYKKQEIKSPDEWRADFRNNAACRAFIAARDATAMASRLPGAVQSPAQPPRANISAMIHQLKILTARFFRVLTIDKRNLLVLLGLAPLVTVMLCLVTSSIDTKGPDDPSISGQQNYFRQQIILSFGSVMIVMFLALFASVREIVKELPIYMNEHFVNLEIGSYLLSKMIVLLGIDVVQTAMVITVVNWYGHIETGTWQFQYGILIMCSAIGTMIGLMVSAFVKDSDAAMMGMIIIVIPEILFSGALITIKGVAKLLAAPLITTFWGLNALMSKLPKSQFDDTQYTKPLPATFMMLGQLAAVAAITYWLMVKKDGPGAADRIARQLKRTLPVIGPGAQSAPTRSGSSTPPPRASRPA